MILDTTFTNGALEFDGDLEDLLKLSFGLTEWIRGGGGGINIVSGTGIQNFVDYSGKNGSLNLGQATPANQAQLLPGQIGGYEAAVFDGNDKYLYGGNWSRSGAWSLAAIYRPASSLSGIGPLLSAWDSPSVQSGITHTNDTVELHHGNGVIVSFAARNVTHCVIMSSDTSVIRGRVDGFDQVPSPTNNAQAASNPVLGALNPAQTDGGLFFKGALADLLLFNADILTNDPVTVQRIELFASRVYGVALSPLVP